MSKRPLIGIPADIKNHGLWPFHSVGDKYVRAVQSAVGDVLILPALGDQAKLARLLPILDGLFLTGSLSNVEPHHYGEPPAREGTLHDPHRDATTLPLIKTVVEMGMPLFGVCRGFQEINVAFGGTLHQHIQELPGKMDHREPPEGDIPTLYADAHEAYLQPGSLLQNWMGGADTITINSLHQQGVKDLGQGLTVEALAPDGIIEAFRINDARHFGYAVQWHPEWMFDEKAPSVALFKAFKEACETYRAQKA
ncbi:putative glutamine amidotransferase [Neisseria sp. HSC-16F19]|nr:gamma-glutamyl-gamma-aminobutyrate hydrolase family protein [Neisseria sp. HSC-16F19]MCP2039595.1 putative glutamine amidotransferase [Neisseria sp. HSC-16F19]